MRWVSPAGSAGWLPGEIGGGDMTGCKEQCKIKMMTSHVTNHVRIAIHMRRESVYNSEPSWYHK